jgi:hypothetical protein
MFLRGHKIAENAKILNPTCCFYRLRSKQPVPNIGIKTKIITHMLMVIMMESGCAKILLTFQWVSAQSD